ncbi:ubiquinol oxidase subunit II [Sphingomonas sp. OTU376]|uniref:ubiquinol oxidase subunit II n=1 Tax=Sphingomonas sp. OTU376 TaxID=3043863 RepID=UPI00313CECBC
MPLLLGSCGDMVVMNPTGDIAVQQRNLILFSTGVMLLIIVPVLALTIWFAWKYRRSNPNKTYDPNFDHSTTLELVIWTCPLLIIIALSAVTWTSTHLLDPFRPLERIAPGKPVPAGTRPLEVQAIGMDWKWLFIYPDLGIATVNELALPVDQPVHFSITSTDQFNTFFAPTLAGMIYAMPTMKSELHAVLNKAGDSWGYSGNYTGAGYSDMRFKLRGIDKAGFEKWVAEAKASGKALDTATYLTLARPSAKVPVMRFSAPMPGLFDKIVNQCVAPGTPCMVDVMRSDMMRAAGKPHDPDHDPAKAPAAHTPPAGTHQDAPKHPGMSALAPFRMPGAARVAQA